MPGNLAFAWRAERYATVRITSCMCRDTLQRMKSFRLDPRLEDRLAQAAAARGESLSEFIRRAASERADATLAADPSADFSDVLGVIHGGGGRARDTGAAFSDALAERKPQG
jgi:hypothetical protein